MSKTGLLFSGQGAQQVGMAKSLYDASPKVQQLFAQANDILGWEITRICFEGPDTELTQTRVCQPALYLHGMAIMSLLQERGTVELPAVAMGLSLGELTALAAAKVYSFEDGLKLVAERGRLMQQACESTEGTMAALIGGSPEAAAALAQACDVDLGNLNCPGQAVLSGSVAGIDTAIEQAKEHGFKLAKKLNVAGAYHSGLMESARIGFAQFLESFEFAAPQCPVYSNVSGKQVTSPEAIKQGLVAQIVKTVRFEDNLRNALADTGVSAYLECGPGGVLAGMAKRTDRSIQVTPVSEFADLPAS